jgi:hypothetical protein
VEVENLRSGEVEKLRSEVEVENLRSGEVEKLRSEVEVEKLLGGVTYLMCLEGCVFACRLGG